jgi:hypothetical protein
LVYTYHGKHVETCTYGCSHDDEFEDEGNMFGVGASFEGSPQALVNGKLYLFRRLFTFSSAYEIVLYNGITTNDNF